MRSLPFIALSAAIITGIAGHADVTLMPADYDFGLIREAEGPVTGRTLVVNNGPDTTYIRDVRPSCGCTGATYDTGSIAPGDTAVVTYTYNPLGRPGNFAKTVKIYTGDSAGRHTVNIRGTVVGTPESLARNYPVECGPLRLSDSTLEMSGIKNGTARHTFVRIVNQSMDTVTPVWTNPSKALSIDVTPKEITPGGIATLGIYFNSRQEERTGELVYEIPFHAEGSNDSVTLRVIADVLPAAPDNNQNP